MQSLAGLRLRLTAWYAAIFVSILALLGGGLFVAIRHRMSQHLDASLRAAAAALMQAARIREAELVSAKGVVADAVDELRIPDRALYLFAAGASPVKPVDAPDWIRDAAREAERAGTAHRDFEAPENHTVRLYAERFMGAKGGVYVAAVVADRLELEDEYASLIRAFGAAALVALLLVAGGGYLLVRKSTAPIERSLDQMRRFMADAAHELRTPITILRTRAEVGLAQDREPARDRAMLEAIARETARLGGLAGDLLTLARADAGERPIGREPLYLDDAVAGAVDAVRALAQHKTVGVDVGTFEEARIIGNPALVRQLLLIVLDNAIKFTPVGGRVRLGDTTVDGRAAVDVTDTGIGIPAAQLPHVFERFYRGDQARREAEGAGLGLAIARWIADAHGARIDISPAPGGGAGTRVTISFPVSPDLSPKERS